VARPRVISLFSGAGGIDYGLEAAGFETAVALEMNHDCCVTLARSRPKWRVIEDDIMNVSSEKLLDTAGLRAGEAELLVGGPPCQPFSKAGYCRKDLTLNGHRSSAIWSSPCLEELEASSPTAGLARG
jgi:DNA (cytosine-5)-methyltransferase 1